MGGVASMDMNVLPVLFDLFQIPEEERFCMFEKMSEAFKECLAIWRKLEEDRVTKSKG